MTDLATAMADTTKLPPYGGLPVVRTAIKVTNAGDGLSQGLAIDPEVLPLGSRVYVVLECVVDSHEHDRVLDKGNDTGLLILNQVLKAGTGTLIEGEVVRDAIAQQADRIQRAKDEAAGRARLPLPEELQAQHDDGQHADGLVPGCPACDPDSTATGDAPPAEPASIKERRKRGGSDGA